MYRSVDEIVNALKSGKTNLKSIRNSVSRYRRIKRLDCVVMYMTAIETYLMEVNQPVEQHNRQSLINLGD